MGCSPNPANYDIPGNNCDDDGDGVVDNPPGMCDSGLAPTGSAANMAAALGLCTGTKPASRRRDPLGDRLGDVHDGLQHDGSARRRGPARHHDEVRQHHHTAAGIVVRRPVVRIRRRLRPVRHADGSLQGRLPDGSARHGVRRSARLPEAGRELYARHRRARRVGSDSKGESAGEREGLLVRLRLLLGRVARVGVHDVQRLVRRVAPVERLHGQGGRSQRLLRHQRKPHQREQRLLPGVLARQRDRRVHGEHVDGQVHASATASSRGPASTIPAATAGRATREAARPAGSRRRHPSPPARPSHCS